MSNGGSPHQHDDRKTVERKESKRTARKRGADQTKKPTTAT